MANIPLGLCALFVLFGLSRTAEAKVIESKGLRWWGGAPACLDITGGHAQAGQSVQLYPCHGEPHQNFLYDESKGSLRSYRANVCLDVDNGVAEEGRRIGMWDCTNGKAQKFRFEEDTGLFRYRAADDYCVAVDKDKKGLHLSLCRAGDIYQTFEFKHAFGDRRFDEVAWVTTHNAHVTSGEAGWLFPNQSRSFDEQLREGVRGFMVDTYSHDGKIELCHGDCGGLPGFAYANPRLYFKDFLGKVTRYLREYPDAIVSLLLEDYSAESDMRKLLESLPEVQDLLFDPYAEGVREEGWPTLDEMIAANKRLLILSSRADKKHLGVGFVKDLTVENYWSLGGLGNKTECRKRWDEIPMDATYGPMEPLFVMNQFRDIPTGLTASIDNKHERLMDRIEKKCLPAAKRKPNFVAVDFYEASDRSAFKVVKTLNQSVAALFEDANYEGRAQLLQGGEYNKDHLSVGNNKASSILIFRHGNVDVYDGDKFTTWLGRFEVSTPDIGAAWNDRTSSVRVEYR